MNKRVSVIIPTYNSYKTLLGCISSLLSQSLKPSEIIVVDNNSSDKTSEIVKKEYPKIKLITLNKNMGVSGGRNAGIKKVSEKSDLILFFDHDMVAEKKMIENLVEVISSDLKIGITTPKIYYFSDKKNIWSAGTGINLWTGQIIFRGGIDNGQYENVEEVQVAPAAILIRKDVLTKIKGFDEIYFATYEDTDFCFRAKSKGFSTFYVNRAIAYHKLPLEKSGESERLLKRLYWVGRNRVIFMSKFSKSFFVFVCFLPVYFIYYLVLSLKYGKIGDYRNFIRGTIDGFKYLWQ